MEAKRIEVTAVVPTKNEAGGVALVLEGVLPYCDELLVIDSHSDDDTCEIARRVGARVVQDRGRGKGDGLRIAIREARGEIIVFIDADGSHEPSDIPKLTQPIRDGKADMVVGSRCKGGSDEFVMDFEHLIRQVGSHIATTLVNYRWKGDMTDIQNGFRAIRRESALSLGLNANDFDIEEEMVMKCLKQGVRVTEIASHEYARQWGESKLPTGKAWVLTWRLLKELAP